MDPLTVDHVRAVLNDLLPGTEITLFDDSTATSQLAADAIGCELGQIAKSICFMVNDAPILVIASGDARVDTRKIATLLDVGRKKVKTAKPEQCIAVFGYAPGGVPPVGHRTPDIRKFVDSQLGRYETVYAAAGAHNSIFPVKFDDLVRVTGGEVADVHQEQKD